VSDKLKILMVCYEYPPVGGGGGRVVAGLAQELVRQGQRVDVVTMTWRSRQPQETDQGVRVHRVPCLRRHVDRTNILEVLTYIPPAALAVRRLLSIGAPDVVNSHFIFPDGLVVLLAGRGHPPPLVLTAHGSDVPGHNPDRLTLLHRLLRPLWQRVTRKAACVVCPSPTLSALVRRQASALPTSIIPNGVDPAGFQGGRQRQARVLVVSRATRRKGIQHVIRAFVALESDFELHIVGDGPHLPTLRAMAASSLGRVRFWGWLDHGDPRLRKLYQTAAIFCLASEVENFPVSLLEAMAAGLAVITTADTGCADVVGDAALLVPAGDIAALREALARLMADPALCQALGRAAERRLNDRFSWSIVAGKYLDLYRRTVAEARAAEGSGPSAGTS
jgi:glycosyltransferase involved in cell wall biosynthesis